MAVFRAHLVRSRNTDSDENIEIEEPNDYQAFTE